jgi:tetratricopeptide (TPR) repeat protein
LFLRENVKPGDIIFQLALYPTDGIPYYLDDYIVDEDIGFIDIFNVVNIEQDALPTDIWWVVRTEGFEEAIRPERIAQLKTLLGTEFEMESFARIAIAHQNSPIADLGDLRHLAKEMLLTEMQFDQGRQGKYAWAWFALGDSYHRDGEFADAASSYMRAIEVSPELVDGYMLLADIYLKQNRLEEALRLYEKATEVNPRYGPSQIQRWNVLLSLGKEDEAKAEINHAMEWLGPQWFETSGLQLCNLLVEHGDLESAIESLTEMQKIVPDSGKLHLQLGEIYLGMAAENTRDRLQYLELALAELEIAERLLPDSKELSDVRAELAIQGFR